MRPKALFCCAFSLLWVLIGLSPLWGQEAAKPGVQTLNQIVVTATGTGVPLKETSTSTTIISKPQIDARQDAPGPGAPGHLITLIRSLVWRPTAKT